MVSIGLNLNLWLINLGQVICWINLYIGIYGIYHHFNCSIQGINFFFSDQELSHTTVHEEDDGDEFILLGMHQLTVTGHCCHIMRVVCPLLVSSRSGIQAASLRLLTACLTLLQQCVQPSILWDKENDDDDEVAVEVAGEIKRVC